MIQSRVCYILFIVSHFVPMVTCCMPTGNIGGEIPITTVIPTTVTPTTPEPNECPIMDNMVSIYISDNTKLQAEVYGRITPISTCTTCADGQVNYYTSATQAIPHSPRPLEAVGSVSAVNCPNMCICATDGTCYNPTSSDVVATLWPYCSGGTCGVYVYITANTDAAGFVSTTGTPTFASGDQVDVNNDFMPKAVPDPSYINAATISCDGCVDSTCQTRGI